MQMCLPNFPLYKCSLYCCTKFNLTRLHSLTFVIQIVYMVRSTFFSAMDKLQHCNGLEILFLGNRRIALSLLKPLDRIDVMRWIGVQMKISTICPDCAFKLKNWKSRVGVHMWRKIAIYVWMWLIIIIVLIIEVMMVLINQSWEEIVPFRSLIKIYRYFELASWRGQSMLA